MAPLNIPDEIYRQMIAQARAEAPIEACGILGGRDGRAEKLYTMTNVDNAAEHFMMAPQEQFAVAKDLRAAGLEMQAVYHSHPASPARPSEEDIRFGIMPGMTYVILSLLDAEPVVKGFLIDDGEVSETPVTITKE